MVGALVGGGLEFPNECCPSKYRSRSTSRCNFWITSLSSSIAVLSCFTSPLSPAALIEVQLRIQGFSGMG
jgi:hypothetical protein